MVGFILGVDGQINVSLAQWHISYKKGLRAMKQGDWKEAIHNFQEALKKKNKDSKKIRAYGVTFIEYFPHRELGICFYHLGMIKRAKMELALSLKQAFSKRARKYIDLINRGEYPKLKLTEKPKPKEPPQLFVELYFLDPSNNGFLDAEETGKLIIDLSNHGRGDAYNLYVKLTPQTDISGVNIGSSSPIDLLPAGSNRTIAIPISSSRDVSSKKIKLKLEVKEANGFDLDPPAFFTFSTKSFIPPELIIADIGIDDQSGNGQIEPREIVDITIRIQNKGQGEAYNVMAAVKVGENVFLAPDSKTKFALGNLQPGEYKDIIFTVFTNSKATSVPVYILLKEARGRYEKGLPLDLPFNKPQKKVTELIVMGKKPETIEIPDVPALSIDVDSNIPKSKTQNPDAIAIILGIERYRSIPNVTYANRDATIFKEYAVRVLGVPDDKNHIYFKTDYEVTKAEFLKLFTGKGWLAKRVQPTSDVYVYYAGHGAPEISKNSPYLIPSDGDANYPIQTGFSLNKFYEELAKINARSITVFLDACFSGGTRENTMLLAEARPVLIKVENPVLMSEKLFTFSAASANQISSGYPDKKHGLFTYFLLKGLRGDADKNYDRAITVEELEEFLVANVKKTAGLLDREQTPQVMATDKQRVIVEY